MVSSNVEPRTCRQQDLQVDAVVVFMHAALGPYATQADRAAHAHPAAGNLHWQ